MYASSDDRYYSDYEIIYFTDDQEHCNKYFEEYEKKEAYEEFELTKNFVKQFLRKDYELINSEYEYKNCTVLYSSSESTKH